LPPGRALLHPSPAPALRELLPVGDLLSDGQVQELLLHLRHCHRPSHLLPSQIHTTEARALLSPSALRICRSPDACCGPAGRLAIAPGRGEVSPAPGTFSHAGVRSLSRQGVLLCPQNLSGSSVRPCRVTQCCSASPPRGRGMIPARLLSLGSTSTGTTQRPTFCSGIYRPLDSGLGSLRRCSSASFCLRCPATAKQRNSADGNPETSVLLLRAARMEWETRWSPESLRRQHVQGWRRSQQAMESSRCLLRGPPGARHVPQRPWQQHRAGEAGRGRQRGRCLCTDPAAALKRQSRKRA